MVVQESASLLALREFAHMTCKHFAAISCFVSFLRSERWESFKLDSVSLIITRS